ncbi:MAG: mitochondrial fission ELM1 family protein [Alphaproteobacteria bacterium]|nr:mitochondrial fission ELM1 family protein [Alphaproteobacteria bacterium]
MHPLTCRIITEGLKGTENQCLGAAEALGLEVQPERVSLTQPWKILSPWLGLEYSGTFSPSLQPPWPDLLITSGRKAVAVSRYIKRASGGKTFTLHIQDPKINSRIFDLVAVPAHDSLRGENVIVTAGAPNRVTSKKLADAKERFSAFGLTARPRVAVLIGGSSNAFGLTPAIMADLVGSLKNLNAGLMITTSRRTGAANERILTKALDGSDAYIWDGQGENPYFGMLAWADHILVTADSVSMLSEAATTGKPVQMIDLKGGRKRIRRFHETLQRAGAVRTFKGSLESWSYEPLYDAEKIAAVVRERLAPRFESLEFLPGTAK